MGQTLTHGIYLPDEGERNCYAGLAANWQILDSSVGTIAEHTTALAGKAPAVHTHVKADITDFPAYGNTAGTICEGNDSRLSDARTPVAHTHGKADITDLFNSANTWTGDNTFSGSNSFNSGLTINNAASLNTVLQNAVKGDVSTTGDFAIFIKDKVNGNATTSLLAVYRGGQDSGGSYAQINIDTKGNDNNRYNNSILFRINPADNSNNAILIPQRDKTIDLGTSTNQWKSVYAQSYYYNGTAWGLDKANIWSNVNTFSNTLSITGNTLFAWDRPQVTIGTIPSSTVFYGTTRFRDSNNTSYAFERGAISTTWNYRQWFVHNFSNASINASFEIGIKHDGTEKYFLIDADKVIPNTTGVSDLGTSDKKWKTLNGVNPGALSLPNYSDVVNLDTTNWSKAGNMIVYTPTFDGWLQITIPNDDDADGVKSNMISILDSGTSPIAGFSVSNILGPRLYFLYPVRASRVYWLYIKSYSSTITVARLVKCLGNV